MLVLLGPRFAATDAELAALADATGMLAYDLRTRLRPGAWGVLRSLAADEQAVELAEYLQTLGFEAVSVDPSVGQDATRRVVYVKALELLSDAVNVRLSEREMVIPYGALLTIVRGEVQLGRSPWPSTLGGASGQMRSAAASTPFRSSNPVTAEVSVFREPRTSGVQDVFTAADIHFFTVNWVARIDARDFEFPSSIPAHRNLAERLDHFVDLLAQRCEIRVDRSLRASSLASYTADVQRVPSQSSPPGSRRQGSSSDEHFDAYSRLVAEAERQSRLLVHKV